MVASRGRLDLAGYADEQTATKSWLMSRHHSSGRPAATLCGEQASNSDHDITSANGERVVPPHHASWLSHVFESCNSFPLDVLHTIFSPHNQHLDPLLKLHLADRADFADATLQSDNHILHKHINVTSEALKAGIL